MAKKLTRITDIPVVILCGGLGTRLVEETETKPKPLVEIGGRPILWHIMRSYAHYGYRNFILCLGYKGQLIRDYFLNYQYHVRDIRVTLGGAPQVELLGASSHADDNWNITLADTGDAAMTGARVKRIEKYIHSDHFHLTYGDGVADVDLAKLAAFHFGHGAIGTVTGVRPPSRFGELVVDKGVVTSFAEKPEARSCKGSSVTGVINGGYFMFSKKFFKYLSSDDACVLERKPLEKLSQDQQLMLYNHGGFWQCMDTMRDVTLLRELWTSGGAPWKK